MKKARSHLAPAGVGRKSRPNMRVEAERGTETRGAAGSRLWFRCYRRHLHLRLLCLKRLPNVFGRLADSLVHHQFTRQRGQYIRAVIH